MSAQGEDRSDFQAVMPPVDRNGKKLDFVVFKATEGTGWTSKTYKQNVANAKAAGVPYGSYHFFHPSLNVDAQIALFLAFVAENGGLNPGTILACDSEIQSGVSERLFLSDGPNRSDLLESSSLSGLARVRDGVSFPTQHLVDSATPTSASVSLVNSATKSFLDGVRTGVEVALGGDYCQEMLYSFLGMLPALRLRRLSALGRRLHQQGSGQCPSVAPVGYLAVRRRRRSWGFRSGCLQRDSGTVPILDHRKASEGESGDG